MNATASSSGLLRAYRTSTRRYATDSTMSAFEFVWMAVILFACAMVVVVAVIRARFGWKVIARRGLGLRKRT
jgi:hypothetical protein